MIGSLLIILFSLVSIAGVIALLRGNVEKMNRFRRFSLSFFTISHLWFLALGMITFFAELSVTWLIIACIFIIASRILNGLALYGKNNWSHYIVTSAILIASIVLHMGDY